MCGELVWCCSAWGEERDSGPRECEIFLRCGFHFACKGACLQIYDCNLHFRSHQYLRRSVSLIYVGVWKYYLFLFQNKKLKNNPDLSYFSDSGLPAVTYVSVVEMFCHFIFSVLRATLEYCIAESYFSWKLGSKYCNYCFNLLAMIRKKVVYCVHNVSLV